MLLQRVEAKAYRDIAALLASGVPLDEILGAAWSLSPAPSPAAGAGIDVGFGRQVDEPGRQSSYEHERRMPAHRVLKRTA